jgi:nitroreductase
MESPATNDSLWGTMSTQRAIRYFRPDPIPDDVLWKVLDHTICAPNGQNRQAWSFVLVRDGALRKRIGEHVARTIGLQPAFKERVESGMRSPDRSTRLMMTGGKHLADHLDDAPVLVLPCIRGPFPEGMDRILFGSAIYLATQNLMLAARGMGLGTVMTSFQAGMLSELREWLELPEDVLPVALIPMGYPDAKFGPLKRDPAENVTHWDRWGSRLSR